MCWGTSENYCNTDFPAISSCSTEGAYITSKSGIRFPADRDLNHLSAEDRQFVCVTGSLESEFKKFEEGRDGKYTLAYIGGSNGMHRRYPATKDSLEDG